MELLYKLTSHNKDTAGAVLRDDFNRRYSECYLIIKLKGKDPQLYYIESLNNDLNMRVIDFASNRLTFNWDQIESCETWFPKSGYYQLNTGCIYLERRVVRQWRRSFNNNSYRHDLRHSDILHLYKAWKNPTQYKFSLTDIDEDSPNIRLTNELAAGYHQNTRKLCIFFEETPIATIKPFAKKISLLIKDFTQEIQDYLKQNQLTDWKIV